MIIRIESSNGTKRVEIQDNSNISKLFELCADAFKLDPRSEWYLSKTRNVQDSLKYRSRGLLKSASLKHGDVIYLLEQSQPAVSREGVEPMEVELQKTTSATAASNILKLPVQEDEVDKILETMDGKIMRERSNYCKHSESGKCIYCVPLEPYDSEYLSHCQPPVKFMSFNAYIRKIQGGHSKGKFVSLENLNCHVRPDCPSHPPWPEGICTKCQPKPVTLEVQAYRHVDYVQFENAQLMETFLDYWRQTGKQRIGLLLGRYAPIDAAAAAAPLSIKAVISAIYEPPQEGTNRSVMLTVPLDQLLTTPVQATLDGLGLKVVGWIFTDLTADGEGQGAVKHYRGSIDTFFMSAEECITAAQLQNLHPNPTRHAADGHFGSKFVTVVVTGGKEGEIHFEGYQVSNVAMALQSANILVPTVDAPELGYIRETTKEQFIPDVFYSSKDKYGNVVTHIGRPLPVEYLLVDMPAAFPIDPIFTFAQRPPSFDPQARFPVANREDVGQKQNFDAFSRFFTAIKKCCGANYLSPLLSNFHVLAWLSGESSLPLATSPNPAEGLPGLLEAIKFDAGGVCHVTAWAAASSHWATLEMMITAISGGGSYPTNSRPISFRDAVVGGSSSSLQTSVDMDERIGSKEASSDVWACQHCTFNNGFDKTECEMCRLPRSG